MIKIEDQFFIREDSDYIFTYCETASYVYGEVDDYNLPPTGMTHEIKKDSIIYMLFESKTRPFASNDLSLHRMYVN